MRNAYVLFRFLELSGTHASFKPTPTRRTQMDIQYKLLKTTREKTALYQFRKQVFVDEENRFAFSSDQITDPYDSIEETLNIGAMDGDQIIAALRVTLDNPMGLPADRHWDFTEIKNQLTGGWACFSWLCSASRHRHKKGLIKDLARYAVFEMQKKGFEHVLAVVHPPIYDLLHECFGVRKIGPLFLDKKLNVHMIPIHVSVNDILGHLNAERFQKPSGQSPETPPQKILTDPAHRLKALGFQGKFQYLEAAFSRNIGIVSLADQEKLMGSRIAIPGLGGVGGQHLITLARAGVGSFNIADFDCFEPVNINRQYGAKTSSLEQKKIEVMYKEAMDINPFLDINCFAEGISPQNIDRFLTDVDLVADGMDFFNFDIRRMIFKRACEKKIPVITAGPLGFSSALLIFMPEEGMTFDQYFDITDRLSLEDKLIRFFIGLAPKATQASYIDPAAISLENQKGPSAGAGCQVCSAVVTVEALRILLNKKGIKPAPYYFQYDLFTRKFHQGYLFKGNRNPFQRIKYKLVKNRLKKSRQTGVLPPKVVPGNGIASNGTIANDIIGYIIAAGCRAPSGDNCQPWTFEYCAPYLKIFLDPLADTSFFNLNQVASHIACGAAIENCLLAASRYGLSGRIAYLPDEKQPNLVAQICLSHTNQGEDALQRFIWERHTNRTRFKKSFLAQTEVEQIHTSLSLFPGVSLVLVTQKNALEQVAKLVQAVDIIRCQRRDLHEHLMEMICFTNEQTLERKQGFPLKNLEAGIGGEMFLKLCRSWPMMHLANQLGMGKIVSAVAARGIRQASAVGLLKINGSSQKDFLTGGQALERLWLSCTRLGLSFQPMTAVTLFRYRWALDQKNDFSLAHQQLLGGIWPLYDDLFDVATGETHILLFRLGQGGNMSCRTLRKENAATS